MRVAGWVLSAGIALFPGVVVTLTAIDMPRGYAGYLDRLVPMTLFLVAVGTTTLSRKISTYYAAIVAQILILGIVCLTMINYSVAYLPLAGFVLLELAFFEPYPRNLGLSLVTSIGISLLVVLANVFSQTTMPAELAVSLAALTTVGVALPFAGRYRDQLLEAQEERDRLGEAVARLTRANTQYQDLAVGAREKAAEDERLRITREIHDVVGYTLTNNIMLMEAALRVLQENVLALPSIVETARENAKEGLTRIRSELYKLRQSQSEFPRGARALVRLSQVFERATGVDVRCDFGNLHQELPDKVDSALYHLVQESLVNAFRHGRASSVSVSFWIDGESVHLSILDDGVGTNELVEGIGISGMRERLANVNGTITISHRLDFFKLHAIIPLDQTPALPATLSTTEAQTR